ncbi:MAG: T9SS type A sorting domain-containing protein [Bacteroidota bacterium]
MKNILLALLLAFPFITSAQTIDAGDTVVFDLSGASCIGNSILVPVSFISDDSIYAIDFSMKYDELKIVFNTIVGLLPNVNTSAFFNPADSTLRFSSFSMWAIPQDTPVVFVKFDMTVNAITESDFNTIHVYLNGDTCSYKFIPPSPPAVIVVVGALTINPGDSIALTAPQGNGFTYLWSTSDTTQTIYVSLPGTYAVSVFTAGGCVSVDSVTIQMTLPLPVELIYFSAAQENEKVYLEWSTASETNNDYFEVEHSNAVSAWSALTEINGGGNTSEARNYTTWDQHPLTGMNYYRLKQVDFDGSIKYSQTITLNFVPATTLVCSVYPNPVADELHVISTDFISVQLFDINGKMADCPQAIISKQLLQIDTRQIPSGVYVVRIFNPGEQTIFKNIPVIISR